MHQFEEEYVLINGMEQYLLHYPKKADAPVLLYLHGGPGEFESLFAYKLDEQWGDMFTHVHWDQRGAGKTLRRSQQSKNPLTVEQMLADLHEVVKHLQKKYRCEKIVILGHSWGSLLGSLYVQKHPEYVAAYIGAGQVVNLMESERLAYRETRALAEKAGNRKHVRALEKLGNYPPEELEALLKQLPKLRSLRAHYSKMPGSGTGEMLRTMWNSPVFRLRDLTALLRAVQVNRPLYAQLFAFDLQNLGTQYEVPVHYIFGEADSITPPALCRAYYEHVEAPQKSFVCIPQAGHNPMYEQPQAFVSALAAVRKSIEI